MAALKLLHLITSIYVPLTVNNWQGNVEANCISFITQNDCKKGTFLSRTENGCLTCKGGLGFGVFGCSPKNKRRTCAPGLRCSNSMCTLDKDLCSSTYHLTDLKIKNLPKCDSDGTYAVKQCKGDKISGRCFCYDSHGNRIFGSDWWSNSTNMTCACSRHRALLKKQNHITDVTLHCQSNGNYETLQCQSGICWCAVPETGDIIAGTRAVPQTAWTILPCYDKNEDGNKYLRQCESGAFAQNLIRKTLARRGTEDVSFNNIICDYDGNYGTYKIENGIAACTWKNGLRIGSYSVNSKYVSQMNCYCARDQTIFKNADMELPAVCAGNGNYESLQDINGKLYCVDQDGYAVSDYFKPSDGFDCTKYMYDKITAPIEGK